MFCILIVDFACLISCIHNSKPAFLLNSNLIWYAALNFKLWSMFEKWIRQAIAFNWISARGWVFRAAWACCRHAFAAQQRDSGACRQVCLWYNQNSTNWRCVHGRCLLFVCWYSMWGSTSKYLKHIFVLLLHCHLETLKFIVSIKIWSYVRSCNTKCNEWSWHHNIYRSLIIAAVMCECASYVE